VHSSGSVESRTSGRNCQIFILNFQLTFHWCPYNIKGKGRTVCMLNELSTMPWGRMEEWKYSSTILDLDTRWRWGDSFAPQPLYPWGESPQYPLNRRLGGPQSWSRCYGGGLCGFGSLANCADRATAACWRSSASFLLDVMEKRKNFLPLLRIKPRWSSM
jgi:hypothetical protein